MTTYSRYAGSTLPSNVGTNSDRGTRLSDGRAGHICYGPFLTLEEGDYCAGFRLRRQPGCNGGQLDMDVAGLGYPSIAHKTVRADTLFEDTLCLIPMEFRVAERVTGVEVRLFAHEGALIDVEELVVFSRAAKSWGGR